MGKAETTRQLIIEKSAELFNKYGYDGCSMSDIMSATGLKKGGIYNHFKSKDEIAISAFDYSTKKVFQRFKEELGKKKKAYDKIMTAIDVYASFADDPVVSGGCPIFNTAVDSYHNHPDLKEKAREALLAMKHYVELKLKQGEEDGEFRCKIRISDMALMIHVALEGAIVYYRTVEDTHSITPIVRNIKNYIDSNLEKN